MKDWLSVSLKGLFICCYSLDESFIFMWHILFQSLLDEPNPNSPANNLAAKLYQENRREYEKKVKVVVEESWVYLGETPSDWNSGLCRFIKLLWCVFQMNGYLHKGWYSAVGERVCTWGMFLFDSGHDGEFVYWWKLSLWSHWLWYPRSVWCSCTFYWFFGSAQDHSLFFFTISSS